MEMKPEDEIKKEIYESLNYKDKTIYPTWISRWRKYSKNSFSFCKKTNLKRKDLFDYNLNVISENFDLKQDLIKSKFEECIGGSGNELKRISVLHSSSLCVFLHFHKISDKNPIIIKNIKYDKVFFEVQNEVIANRNPSNIDIVLISTEKKIILFLEAKFSEYLYKNITIKVSEQYKEHYNMINNLKMYYPYKSDSKDNEKIVLRCQDGNPHYMEGIKQMLSHYIGVCNFIKNNYNSLDKKIVNENVYNDFEVRLGEIVFNEWGNNQKFNDAFEDYQKEYQNLSKLLNMNSNKPKKLKVFDDLLTYQDVFQNNDNNLKLLNEKIRKFYRYDK